MKKTLLILIALVLCTPIIIFAADVPLTSAGQVPSLAAPTGPGSFLGSCGTINQSGSYVLVRNLQTTGDCLLVLADWVTIDLNGFVISGSGTGSGIGSAQLGRTGITVRNGTIRGFSAGIDFAFNGGQMLVEKMRLFNNVNYGVGTNDSSVVKDCIATGNGIGFFLGSRSVVTGNTANFNQDGFSINVGSTVIGNTAGNNSRDGFQTQNGVTVVNNTAFANGRYGFLREGGNFVANTATLSGVADVMGGANNSVNNVPSP